MIFATDCTNVHGFSKNMSQILQETAEITEKDADSFSGFSVTSCENSYPGPSVCRCFAQRELRTNTGPVATGNGGSSVAKPTS